MFIPPACRRNPPREKTGKRVAIIGAGPAGLGAAGQLGCKGHEVHVYDKMPEPGGLLIYGVYEARMNRALVRRWTKELSDLLGVVYHLNTYIPRDVDLEDLIKSYDAVLIATGTWKTRRLNCPGENLHGVYYALEFMVDYYLTKYGYKPMYYESLDFKEPIMIIGGGLTAVDAVLVSLDMGYSDIILSYRRTREYAPAGKKEFDELEKKGVKIMELTQPVAIHGKERVEEVELVRNELVPSPGGGRPRPKAIPGSNFRVKVGTVIPSIGLIPTPPFNGRDYGIELTEKGTIKTNEKFMTTREKVFAAGDVKHGAWLIGPALKSGIDAAKYIDEYLRTGVWEPPA